MNVPLTQCRVFDQDALANILLAGPAAGCLSGAFLICFSAPAPVSPDLLLADPSLVKCTFAGYADKAITWLAVGESEAGLEEAFGTTTLLAATDSVTPQHVQCIGIVDSAKAKLYFVANLADTIPMTAAGDQALITVRMNVDGSASLEILD